MKIIEKDITSVNDGNIILFCEAKGRDTSAANVHAHTVWPDAAWNLKSNMKRHRRSMDRVGMLTETHTYDGIAVYHIVTHREATLFRPAVSEDTKYIASIIALLAERSTRPIYIPYNKNNPYHRELFELLRGVDGYFCQL